MDLWDGDAEQALVGATFLDETIPDKTAIRQDHFGSMVWGAVWGGILELRRLGKPLDPVVLSGLLRERGCNESIILDISRALAAVPTSTNADHYAEIIRDKWLERQIAFLADELKASRGTGKEKISLLDSRVNQLLLTSGGKLPTLAGVIDDELRALREPVGVGLPSGIGLELVVPGGIPTDRICTIFGESGSFKSTVKNAIVHSIASAGHVVVDCSFEDSNSLTAARWISRDTGIPYGELAARQRRVVGNELPSRAAAGRVIAAGDMAPTVDEVIRVARQYKRVSDAKAVVVDYIQLLEGGPSQRETLDEAMRRLQVLAKRENLAVILVSQIKQDQGLGGQYARRDPRPILHDMLGSSALRTGTKLAVGVFRPFNSCKAPVSPDGPFGLYSRLRDAWPGGFTEFDEKLYPSMLELIVCKQVAGVSPCTVYAVVDAPTGVIKPFDMERYLP